MRKFNADVVATVKDHGMLPIRTAFRSPWQNGIAERWVGSVRRDLLDHVIVLNQRHLRRLMRDYIRYYHEDRTHLGLGKDTPDGRVAASAFPIANKVVSLPRLGGLHPPLCSRGLDISSCAAGLFAVRNGGRCTALMFIRRLSSFPVWSQGRRRDRRVTAAKSRIGPLASKTGRV